jgi:hypothetical protein
MRAIYGYRILIATALLAATIADAAAQVPPHTAGTICATPAFWCWAVVNGPPGERCVCPTTQGMVEGIYI